MSITTDERCLEVEESIAEILDGVAPARLMEHIADCDRCRDLKYEAEQASELVAAAGADFQPTDGFAERILGLVLEKRADGPQPGTSPVSTSGVVTRDPRALAPPSSTPEILSSAKTEFAAPEGAIVDNAATVFEPVSKHTELQVDAEPKQDAKQEAAADVASTEHSSEPPAPFVPAQKTIPLSEFVAERRSEKDSARKDTDPDRVVEAVTGKNNTGAAATSNRSSRASKTLPEAGREIAAGAVRPSGTQEMSAPPVPLRSPSATKVDDGKRGNVVSLFRRKGFLAALIGGMAAAAAIGGFALVKRHHNTPNPPAVAELGWSGTVDSVTHASTDGAVGFEVCKDTCQPASSGAQIGPGSTLRTDSKTRARVSLADGTWIALDRNSEVTLPAGSTRVAKVERGMVIADVNKVDGAEPAKLILPQGEVAVLGTKVACTVTDRRAAVEVVRGEVEVTSLAGSSAKVRAGEEATLSDRGEPVVAQKTTMSDMLEWSSESADDVDAPALRGVGELRARKPGSQEERANAVKLTKHDVKVRVVDVVARTEVDETFTNQTDEELEGIFRFPLPPGAQIEKLALEVDGKLVEGSFVDRDRGAAIWRGVIQNAAPKAPKPREEIVWVPGPWRDPALLEWQRGGRFELRIFPIPKKGSRRVVLTYTQTVAQSAGVRRFTYPMAHDGTGSMKIDDFNLDVQILGHDKAYGVDTRGYQLTQGDAVAGADRFVMHENGFIPAGDLTVEYALPNRSTELTAWAYSMPTTTTAAANTGAPAKPIASTNAKDNKKKVAEAEAKALTDDGSPYVAISVRPKLPRFPEGKERLHVIVVDSSRSMVGERFARATRLAAGIVREMDRRDEFMVLACDMNCQVMGASADRTLPPPLEPSAEAAQQVESFLGSVEPDGGSNLLAAVQAARTAAGNPSGRELRIIYLGDGTPTVGPTKPSTIEAAVRHVLPSGDGSVVAVALGADADTTSLASLARGGNGVVVPYVPGQRVNAAAVDVLASAYGSVLSDVDIVLPPGLKEITPRRMDPIPAGGETFILARMTGERVEGTVTLRGRVGSERFEQSYPASIVASTSAGNAFVPRLFAAAKISDLEQASSADDRERIVALSQQFNVASRHTSMLVLESEAMFKAFGVDRSGGFAPVFTGEDRATSSSSDTKDAGDEEERADRDAAKKEKGFSDDEAFPGDVATESSPKAAGKSAGAADAPRPQATATAAPPSSNSGPIAKPRNDPFFEVEPSSQRREPPRPGMVAMRKVFDRKASFSSDLQLKTDLEKVVTDAQAALNATPDSRDKTVALYKALVASSRLGEATELAAKWSQRDALDPDALIARADMAAMNGERERALRILSGLADVRPGDKQVQKRLISAFNLMGSTRLACQHRLALADLDATDVNAMAAAVRCSQDLGLTNLSQAVLSSASTDLRDKIDSTSRSLKLSDVPALLGDVRVSATWTGGADLDLAIVDKSGRRMSWLGSTAPNVTVTAKDASSTLGETLAVSNLNAGNFTIEIVRAATDRSTQPISGEVTMQLPGGETRRVPFTLSGARTDIGTVRVFFTSRLVPVNGGGGGGGWRGRSTSESG
ncbi:MAG: VIT domain-containing protein [Polyangiaceae bacterium]